MHEQISDSVFVMMDGVNASSTAASGGGTESLAFAPAQDAPAYGARLFGTASQRLDHFLCTGSERLTVIHPTQKSRRKHLRLAPDIEERVRRSAALKDANSQPIDGDRSSCGAHLGQGMDGLETAAANGDSTPEYGNADWEVLWKELEQAGNVGIDHVINPSLYPRILGFLADHPRSIVVDFGCGTNLMAIELLLGHQDSIPALIGNLDLWRARFNTLLYIGVEGSIELVERSNKYLRDIEHPTNIATILNHIDGSLDLFDAGSVDLCVSRNFLMHLSAPEFDAHMAYVAMILNRCGKYIFTTLNPEYELKKIARTGGEAAPIAESSSIRIGNGDRYDYAHGRTGEHGIFYHYYKTTEYIKGTIEKYFSIESIEPCRPRSDSFRESHARYYDPVPMAHTYVLAVKK